MKVLLQTTVQGIGRTGQVVDVADAYARNFLLPQRLAVVATQKVIASSQQLAKRAAAEQARQDEEREKTLAAISEQRVLLEAQASSSGTLFAAVKTKDIFAGIHRQLHLHLETLVTCHPDHLKTTGDHRVELRWPGGQRAIITVVVRPAS